MKALLVLFTSLLLLLSDSNGIEIVYKKDISLDKTGLIYYSKKGNDQLERSEKILKEAETEIVQFAKERRADLIEICVLDKGNGKIPTESQDGKIGFGEIFFSLKSN